MHSGQLWENQELQYLLAIVGRLRSVRSMAVSASPKDEFRSVNPDSVFMRLAPQMGALDDFMRNQAAQFEPEIREMAAYCLETSGKRLRPALVFISGWREDGVIDPDLVRAAGVVEMVHLATLVHDDIMDLAEIRRNRRTAARQFGPDAAVLLGDALFSQALHIASQFPTTEVCRLVSESTRKVCSGEIMQTLRRRDFSVSLEEYRRMIDLKTAELFRVSCFLGAQIAGYDRAFAIAADRFGHHLGIAYQIYDDLVDFVGEERQIGKTLGTDLASGKLTLPLMLLLDKVPQAERLELIETLRNGSSPDLAASKQRMRDLGIAEAIACAIDQELVMALTALESHLSLAPVPLMQELAQLLKTQVAALRTMRVSR
jgi:octaprenyl-diphosphate synthase